MSFRIVKDRFVQRLVAVSGLIITAAMFLNTDIDVRGFHGLMNNIYGLGQNLIQVQASGHLIVVFSYLFCLTLFFPDKQVFNDFPPQEYQQTKGEQKQVRQKSELVYINSLAMDSCWKCGLEMYGIRL